MDAGNRSAGELMRLTKKTEPVPALQAIDGIASGGIYIADWTDGTPKVLAAGLDKGSHAVLITAQGESLELTTRDKITGTPTEAGTYLNAVDLATFSDTTEPRLRRYTWRDTCAKVRTAAGTALLLPALLGVLAGAASLFFTLSTANQPPAATVGDSALAVTAWAVHDDPNRARLAEYCLLSIEGHQAPTAVVPGVNCAPPATPLWRSTLTGSIVSGVLAALTAVAALLTLPSHYRFGKKPSTAS
jgi:hypothetical protein